MKTKPHGYLKIRQAKKHNPIRNWTVRKQMLRMVFYHGKATYSETVISL